MFAATAMVAWKSKPSRVGLAAAGEGHPGRTRHPPDLQHPWPGAWPQGTPALDRRTRDAGEGEGRLGQGIGGVVVRRLGEHTAAPQKAQDSGADCGDEPRDLDIGRRRGRVEAHRAVGGFGEHAVGHQRVGMNVELEAGTKPLNHRAARAMTRQLPGTRRVDASIRAPRMDRE